VSATTTAGSTRATVPPELVMEGDFDEFAAEGDDPFLAISRLHDRPPVIWGAEANFKRPGWIAEMLGEPVLLNLIEIDPPMHHHYRRIFKRSWAR